MKHTSLLIITISCLFCLTFSQTDTEIVNGTVNYSNFNGIQGLLLNNNDAKLFFSLTGDDKMVEGKIILLLKYAKSKVQQNGIWTGIGFGSNKMAGTDFVFAYYAPNDALAGGFVEDVQDSYGSTTQNNIVMPDVYYTNPQDSTVNNVVNKSFTVSDINVSGFLTRVEVVFTKDISKLDAYDWKDFKSWKTNKGSIMGTWGWNSEYADPIQHSGNPGALSLVNGFGLVELNSSKNISSISFYIVFILMAILL